MLKAREYRLMGINELFTNPKPCLALEQMRQELREREQSCIDPTSMRSLQDWDIVNNLIVGAEDEAPSEQW